MSTFKRGDRVRVMKPVFEAAGWENVWVPRMNAAVGKVFIVEGDYEELGIELFSPEDSSDEVQDACDYRYPPGCMLKLASATTELETT